MLGRRQDRCVAKPGPIDMVSGHPALDAELQSWPATHGAPEGTVLPAKEGGQLVGAVAYRDLRRHVRDEALLVPERRQRQGSGRALRRALIDIAAEVGFRVMRFDLRFHTTEALAITRSLGVRGCAVYREYPDEPLPHVVFPGRPLVTEAESASG